MGAPLEGWAVQVSPAITRGDSLMAAFRTVDAIETYREGLATHPEDPPLLWKASLALSSRAEETPGLAGDEAILEEAVALARRAVTAGPEVSRAHTALAVALGRYGRYLAHAYRFNRAREVVELGRQTYAAARRATLLDPADFAPHIVLGVWHRELSTVHPLAKTVARVFLGGYPDVSLAESEAHLRHAMRLAPGDVTVRLELARTYVEMEQDDRARRELRAAIALPARSRLDHVEQDEARELLAELS